MHSLVIINNAAAKARRSWPNIKKQLDSAGLKFDTYETKEPGDATVKTREALRNGMTTIAVVGGDGTLSEVAEGFFSFNDDLDVSPIVINPNAKLALFPAGTGDDFARGLRRKRSSLQSWVDTFISQSEVNVRSVDVLYGRCNDFQSAFICLNASTMGIGGETATLVAGQGKLMRNFSGEFRFAAAAFRALSVWRERRVRVTVDGQVIADAPMNLIGVANGLYAGGGMMLSPDARADDGKLDVVTASGLSRTNVVTELSRVHRGGHVGNPKVKIVRGETVRIETFSPQDALPIEADGNVRGVTPVQFQVLPGALRIVS
ncbi:MAG TPA: YegS/Rv2252/BmrU family lipid kinase [Pyrinomonadaceae bacterium]|jgi:lipid kinase, YegS/Rv2252/BmrU family|nr:YegS/Rv2252/BmrU family lipid kinase [Pyrinomonadaceae bacterium]